MPTAEGHEPMPEPLHQQTPTTYVLRDRIYKPANRQNNWSAFVLVGREGSGKSHTCARILEDVDPTFDASRVFFDPLDLIEFIQSGIGPPSDEFIEEYERRKEQFKAEYMAEITADEDDGDDDPTPDEVVDELATDEESREHITSIHGNTGEPYIDKERIYTVYDSLTHREAKYVKKTLESELSNE